MSKFKTIKVWRKTLKTLKLICTCSGNSMVKEIDDFAEKRLEELAPLLGEYDKFRRNHEKNLKDD